VFQVGTLVSIFGVGMAYISSFSPTFPPPFEDTAEEPTAWVYAVYGAYWSFGGWQVKHFKFNKLKILL
jgi:hypothetical protein